MNVVSQSVTTRSRLTGDSETGSVSSGTSGGANVEFLPVNTALSRTM